MTEKRFTLKYIEEQHLSANLYDKGTFIGSIGMGEELIVELLNQLNDECEFLEIENESLEDGATKYAELSHKVLKENEQLKQDNTDLMMVLKNQSIIIQELYSKLLEYELKEPKESIILTKEDLEIMGKAISYYTHGRCGE